MLLCYLDGDTKPLAQRLAQGGLRCGFRAAYLWAGEIEAASAVYAPGRPDIVAAYAAAGIGHCAQLPTIAEARQVTTWPTPERLLICAPGPQLLATLASHAAAVAGLPVLAVNSAACWVAATWWLALDGYEATPWWASLGQRLGHPPEIQGDPIRMVHPATIATTRGPWAAIDDLLPGTGTGAYTMATALRLAKALGAREILIAGMDWQPGPGIDGEAGNRDAPRFASEAAEVQPLIEQLRAAGISVQRLGPAADQPQPRKRQRKAT